MTRIYPVYREQAADYFTDKAIVPPRAVSPVTGVSLMTAPLVFGKKIDLLGISTAEALLAIGAIDMTDSIDPSAFMDTVYFKDVNKGTLAFNMVNVPTGHFTPSTDNHREIVLTQTYRLTSEDGKTWVAFKLAGAINLESGNLVLNISLTGASNDLILDQLQAVGYELQAFRANHNRRPIAKIESAKVTG